MSNLPIILHNPMDPIFNLEENEIYSLKESMELIQLEKYSYALFAIWNSVTLNIQRRIESFGIENFLNIFENSELYNKSGNTLKERWLNINEYQTINYALKLSIINHITHDIITTLFWMKSNTNEEEIAAMKQEEVYALVYLLEKNLFLKEFKIDKRKILDNSIEFKRRDKDKEELVRISATTQHELLLKATAKKFEENEEATNKSGKLLNSYI